MIVSDPENIVDLLMTRKMTISFAESLTGGMISSGIVDVPGASRVFSGAVVSYTDDYKINVLGVEKDVIKKHTAVSKECAIQMAAGALKLSGSDISISVTGYAGPDGGEDGTLAGTVYIGYADRFSADAFVYNFTGTRNEVRTKTRDAAYKLLYDRITLL